MNTMAFKIFFVLAKLWRIVACWVSGKFNGNSYHSLAVDDTDDKPKVSAPLELLYVHLLLTLFMNLLKFQKILFPIYIFYIIYFRTLTICSTDFQKSVNFESKFDISCNLDKKVSQVYELNIFIFDRCNVDEYPHWWCA